MRTANRFFALPDVGTRFRTLALGGKTDIKAQYLLSTLAVWLLTGICFLFTRYVIPEVIAFILLLLVSVLAMFLDIWPVLIAALQSALIWDYFFLPPRFNFGIGTTEDRIMLSMYFVVALINGILTSKIRRMEKAARDKEEKAQSLRFYNTLLNALSHEFRTPIAAIAVASDNLLQHPSPLSSEDQHRLLTEISNASWQLNRQVENLLNLSRLESGVIQPKKDWCDLSELVYATLRRLDEPLKQRQVHVDIPDGLPLFRLDYGLMEQVLYNLLFNACRYTPPGTAIAVRATRVEDCAQFVVEDQGPGFPEEEIPRVFSKFHRLKNAPTGGTGLGLSIVKGFVEAHNGAVVLDNMAPAGARFTITIPTDILFIKQ